MRSGTTALVRRWSYCVSRAAASVESLELGPFLQPTWQLIKADQWQSARSLGEWSLVHCTVSPGFCFDDFELIAGDGRTDRRPTPQVG